MVGDNRTGATGSDGASSAVSRSRGDRPITGFAVQRDPSKDVLVSFPLYGPWGRYYPWYAGGFGWGYGYSYYDPWRYGATRWVIGRYGMWYDPYWYYPYNPYYYDDAYYGGSYRAEEREAVRTGSIRLKADPKTARVYIDGALVGVVDDFDGLRDHLEIEVGTHELELRADGFETWVGQVTVEAGKTRTERISLKKK
jgi:hypothetical protein